MCCPESERISVTRNNNPSRSQLVVRVGTKQGSNDFREGSFLLVYYCDSCLTSIKRSFALDTEIISRAQMGTRRVNKKKEKK